MTLRLEGPLFVVFGATAGSIVALAPIALPLKGKAQYFGLGAGVVCAGYFGIPLGLELQRNPYASAGMAFLILSIGVRLIRDRRSVGPPAALCGAAAAIVGLVRFVLDVRIIISGTAQPLRLTFWPATKAVFVSLLFLGAFSVISRLFGGGPRDLA